MDINYVTLHLNRQDAKWGRDIETQKRAIQKLVKMGSPAMNVLEEVMAVSSSKDIRECCQDVINGIANVRTEAGKNQPEKKEEKQIPQEKKP